MSANVRVRTISQDLSNTEFVSPDRIDIESMTSREKIYKLIENDKYKNLLMQTTFVNSKAKENSSRPYQVASTFDKMVQFDELGLELLTRKKIKGTVVWDKTKSEGSQKDHTGHILAYSSPKLIFNDPEIDKELSIVIFFTNSFNCFQQATLNLVLFNKISKTALNTGSALFSVSFKHSGKHIEQNLIDSIDSIADLIKDKVLPFIRGLKSTILTTNEQLDFAKKMFDIRLGIFELPEDASEKQVKAMQERKDMIISTEYNKLIIAHKKEMEGDSLWLVMQRIFENLQINDAVTLDRIGRPISISYSKHIKDPNGKINFKTKETKKLRQLVSMLAIADMNHALLRTAEEIWNSKK